MAAAGFTADPEQLNFGERAVGEQYFDHTIYLDGAPGPVTIESLELTGAGAAQFTLDDWNCVGTEIEEGLNYCEFRVNFVPDSNGLKEAEVQIGASSGDPVTVPLSGTGVPVAANAPDLAAPIINEPLAGTSDLWGYAGGDFQGEGRSGVITNSQMTDSSVKAGFSLGQQNGSLSEPEARDLSPGGSAGGAAVGDFNADGDLDAVASGGNQGMLYLNEGDGVMATGTPIPDDGEGMGDPISVGDFTAGTDLDVVSGYIPGSGPDSYRLLVAPGQGDGTFGTPVATPVDVEFPLDIKSGDFNDDGVGDLALTDAPAGAVIMFTGDGDGTFTETDRFEGCGCLYPWGVDTADFNGDGRDDVVATVRFSDLVLIYLAQPDGTFVRGQRLELPMPESGLSDPYSVSARDLNGDRKPDLVTGNYASDDGSVFVGDGDGTFTYAETIPTSEIVSLMPHGTFIGDFNGDGRPDPSIAGQSGDIAVYLNQGEPGQMLSPEALDFGDQTDGTESAPQTVTLSNQDGLAELRVTLVEVAGGFSNDFAIKGGDCLDAPIPVGGSCQVEVSFTPVGPAGSRDSTLYFNTNNTAEGQITVPLTGMSIDPVPAISIDPASLEFGNVEVGSESAVKSVAVNSTGTGLLHIDSVTLGGPGAASFTQVASDCVGSFNPGTGCQISYLFKPSVAGAASATVELATNTAALPVDIGLSGTGQAKPVVQPPRVIVKKRPKGLIRIRTRKLKQVRVAFRANQAGATFQCRIDRRKFSRCKSPRIFRNIKPGRHAIRIRAIRNGSTGPVKLIKFRVVRKR